VALAGDALHFADPCWLGQLERGGKLAEGAVTLGLALTLVVVAGSIVHWPSLAALTVAVLAAGLLPLIVLLLAAWRLASPNPAVVGSEDWRSPRRVVRCAIGGAIATALVTLMALALAPQSRAWLWIQVLGAPLGLLGVAGALGYAHYVRALAQRIDDRFTASRSQIYSWGFFLAWLLFMPSAAAVALEIEAGLCAMIPGLLGMLVLGALTLLLPTYLLKKLRQIRAEAERIWRESGTGGRTG
jgi:hypothetical protein